MSREAVSAGTASWNDPERCPFCNARLEDGGWGFISHVGASSPCKTRFDRWRNNISSDIGGEWSG